MDLLIREITEAELPLLIALFERNDRPEVTRRFRPFPLSARSARRIAERKGRDRFYLALVSGVPVGMAMLRGWDEGFTVPSFGVFVDYEHQGHGIGKRLTLHALSEASRLGCRQVRLTVHQSNPRAVRLYQSLGFEVSDQKEVEIGDEKDLELVMLLDSVSVKDTARLSAAQTSK